jgi:hypothetical protein
MGPHEWKLREASLAGSTIADGGQILAEDWGRAKAFASRVSQDAGPRDFGDRPLAAIARRRKLDPLTSDQKQRRRSRRNLGNDR